MKDSSSYLATVASAHEVPPDQEFFLVGIGGAGMSVVALLLQDLGYAVSGTDRDEVDTLAQLRARGIVCHVGQRAEQVPAGAIVVASSAIHEDNPEIQRARELGLEIWHRSQALDFCTRNHDLVAVAGAHGKTSTSAMISFALLQVGADPSFAIGGTIASLQTGARLGRGRPFVIEADESDGSFLNYSPLVEVLTNIEPDHLDHWGTPRAFENGFVDFTRRLRPGGTLVACGDDAGVARICSRFNPDARLISYGFGSPLPGADVTLTLGEPRLQAGSSQSEVTLREGGTTVFTQTLKLLVGGRHMLLNAAGALAASYALGVNLEDFTQALGSFSGAARRMERVGELRGVRIYDDYGHHPTEIAATLDAARLLAGEGRLLVCFQPHLYSRTFTFAKEFAEVLSRADSVVVCGIYAAREEPLPGVDGATITKLMDGKGRYVADMFEAGRLAFAGAKPGDLLLFLGAGSITHVAHDLVKDGSKA